MSTPYFRIARTALGLSAQEIASRVGKSLRTIRLYDAGALDPAPEAASITSQMITEMAQKLEPYLSVRSGTQKTFTLYNYSNEEELHANTHDEYRGWTLEQYRAFLGHLMVSLEAKGLSYRFVQHEQKDSEK